MTSAADRLANELADLRRRVAAMERGSQLAHSTVTVDGQAVRVPDALTTGVQAAAEIPGLRDDLDQAASDLVDTKDRIDNEVLPAIDDAAASPVTDARLAAGSLTTWPFKSGVVPNGALAKGAVGEAEIADFSLVARKFNDDRHRIY